MKVKLTYFKPSGKFYAEGEYETRLSADDLQHPPGARAPALFKIWEEVAQIRNERCLPGLISGHSWFGVLIDAPDHPHRHPHFLPGEQDVVLQLVECKYDFSHSGIRLVIDGEVVDTGQFGGEPEDNIECRDYKWVKAMLVTLAEKLGARSRIETVEVDDQGTAYWAAMAAPYRKPEAP